MERRTIVKTRFLENKQKIIEKRWIKALQKDYKTAKVAFNRLLKLSAYQLPASILLAASKWDADKGSLLAEFNKLKKILPIDLISKGDIGSISKFESKGIFGITDIGGRRNNEDAIAVFKHKGKIYLLLADGVGGAADGEIASHLALLHMMVALEKDPHNLDAAIRKASDMVKQGIESTGTPGTTLVVAMIEKDLVTVAHVGDSPIFLLKRSGELRLLTLPHSQTINMARMIRDKDVKVFIKDGLPEEIKGELNKIDMDKPPFPFKLLYLINQVEEFMIGFTPFTRRMVGAVNRIVGIKVGDVIPIYNFRIQKGERLLLTSDGLDLTWHNRKGMNLGKVLVEAMNQTDRLGIRMHKFMQVVRSLQGRDDDNASGIIYEA